MVIKVLGYNDKSTLTLLDNTKNALKKLNIEAKVLHITDDDEISLCNQEVPVLVVNGMLTSFGKILDEKEIRSIIERIAR